MTESSQAIPHELKSALKKLKEGLDDAIGERNKRGEPTFAQVLSPDLSRSIQRFVDAFYRIEGGRTELQRRATWIDTHCGPESDYEIARVTVKLSYQFVPEAPSSSQRAMGSLLRSTSQPLYLSTLDKEWDELQRVLTDRELELVDSTRQAYQDWRDTICRLQQLATPLEVDACRYLFYFHEGCEGRQSERTDNASAFAYNNLEKIADAADSLVAWVSENRHDEGSNHPTVVPTSSNDESTIANLAKTVLQSQEAMCIGILGAFKSAADSLVVSAKENRNYDLANPAGVVPTVGEPVTRELEQSASGEQSPEPVQSREPSSTSGVQESTTADSYVQAHELSPKWSDHFPTWSSCSKWLNEHHGQIPNESRGRRRWVHAAKWTRFWASQDKKSFDALDKGDPPPLTDQTTAFLKGANERLAQLQQKKQRKK